MKNPADEVKSTMWGFLMSKGQKANIPALKDAVYDLIGMTTQKTAGQRATKKDISWQELEMTLMFIVIEATALVLSGELDKKGKWIPVGERLPKEDRWVQVTVKRHRWVSNFDEKIPDEERIDHPECIYCTLGRYEILDSKEGIWEFLDLESESECLWTSFTNDCSTEDLSYPMADVIAWQPLPEVYKEGADE